MSDRTTAGDDDRDDGRLAVGTVRLEATVIGRVQGVGFRYFALEEGMALGLDGWVANSADGTVRCVAEGPRERLEILLERLRTGPAAAIVSRVSEAWLPATGTLGPFTVRSGAHRGD
jgi:acylphosphatase